MSRDGNTNATSAPAGGIAGLEEMLKVAGGQGFPPVDLWNPPLCGDIGLEIRSDGTWAYQGSPIGRRALVTLFARVLRRDEDGGHFLVTPVEKVPIRVADAPFLAVEMAVQGRPSDPVLLFRTNVDDVVRCGSEHPLRFEAEAGSGGLKPYVHVRGRLEARLTRALTYDLVELAVEEPTSGRLGILSGGLFFPIDGPDRQPRSQGGEG